MARPTDRRAPWLAPVLLAVALVAAALPLGAQVAQADAAVQLDAARRAHDNGDFELSHDAGLAGPDGPLAATFHLGGVSGTSGQVPDDPELARLYEERAEIQGRIDEVRALRESMSEDQYLDALEPLLVELALKNREIRAIEEGGA